MQCNDSFGCNFDRFSPEFQFRMNRSVQLEMFRLGVKGADWRMMADLFAHDPITQVRPGRNQNNDQFNTFLLKFLKFSCVTFQRPNLWKKVFFKNCVKNHIRFLDNVRVEIALLLLLLLLFFFCPWVLDPPGAKNTKIKTYYYYYYTVQSTSGSTYHQLSPNFKDKNPL